MADRCRGADMPVSDGESGRWPCPCCGYLIFTEPPGGYEICTVCGWEDDLSQLRFPLESGANRACLLDAQAAFAAGRANQQQPRAELTGVRRDPGWRPLDPARDHIERSVPGTDYGLTYPADSTAYYWWRDA